MLQAGEDSIGGTLDFLKFRPVEQLAHLLDIVVNERLYCEHYEALNDPFEGQGGLKK